MNAKTNIEDKSCKSDRKYLYSEFYDRMVGILTGKTETKRKVSNEKILTEDIDVSGNNIFQNFESVFGSFIDLLNRSAEVKDSQVEMDLELVVRYVMSLFPALNDLAKGGQNFLKVLGGWGSEALANEFKDPKKNLFHAAHDAINSNDFKAFRKKIIEYYKTLMRRKENPDDGMDVEARLKQLRTNITNELKEESWSMMTINGISTFLANGVGWFSDVVDWYMRNRDIYHIVAALEQRDNYDQVMNLGPSVFIALANETGPGGTVTVDFLTKTLEPALRCIGEIYAGLADCRELIARGEFDKNTSAISRLAQQAGDEGYSGQQKADQPESEDTKTTAEENLSKDDFFDELKLAEGDIEESAEELGRQVRQGIRIFMKKDFNKSYNEQLSTDIREMLKFVSNVDFKKG